MRYGTGNRQFAQHLCCDQDCNFIQEESNEEFCALVKNRPSQMEPGIIASSGNDRLCRRPCNGGTSQMNTLKKRGKHPGMFRRHWTENVCSAEQKHRPHIVEEKSCVHDCLTIKAIKVHPLVPTMLAYKRVFRDRYVDIHQG